MAHEYNPLRNVLNENDEIVEFRTDEIGVDLNNPLNIECQPSYDGTVNLIINDDKNPPRIINDRYTQIEDDRYRIINRNQLQQTNLYKKGEIDSQTRLFRNINKIPTISLRGVNHYGRLKGGNYVFYVKFADNDYNKTDIVCESGIVSIFKGSLSDIPSISGTLVDEITDKTINLTIRNIDTTFSKVYLYYTRETSDLNGVRVSETGMIRRPYEIKNSTLNISLNGYEEVDIISEEELNIKYNLVTAVKTQAQVQNMLFFGNIQSVVLNNKDLQNISLYIKVSLEQEEDTIGYVENNYKTKYNSQTKTGDDLDQNEYYNPMNIYYKLGYWPGEIYRLGIVYQMIDDSLSPVYNLRGCKFILPGGASEKMINFDESSKYPSLFDSKGNIIYVPQDDFIEDDAFLDNTKGVFRNPDMSIIDHTYQKVKPLYYKIQLDETIQSELKKLGVKGYFIVRQRRIPITLCQALSVGVDRVSYTPMLFENDKDADGNILDAGKYIGESFIDKKGVLTTGYDGRKITVDYKQSSGLLSVEAMTNPILQSMFDGTNYTLQKVQEGVLVNTTSTVIPPAPEYPELINIQVEVYEEVEGPSTGDFSDDFNDDF